MHINHRRKNRHKCEKSVWRQDHEFWARLTGIANQRSRRLKSSRRYRREIRLLVAKFRFDEIISWGAKFKGYKSPGKYIWITD